MEEVKLLGAGGVKTKLAPLRTLRLTSEEPNAPTEIAPPEPALNVSATAPLMSPGVVKVIGAPGGNAPLPVVSITMDGVVPPEPPRNVEPACVKAPPVVWYTATGLPAKSSVSVLSL